MARIDHTACTHPRTPAGRRACRTGNVPAGSAFNLPPVSDAIKARAAELYARSLADNRAVASAPVTVGQPYVVHPEGMSAQGYRALVLSEGRKYDARTASTCVQAGLHTSGRCACGWHADNFCNTAVYACTDH